MILLHQNLKKYVKNLLFNTCSCSKECTSLMTTIGFGLILIYTHETSVHIKDYPYIIGETNNNEILIDSIIKMCTNVAKLKRR